MKSPRFSSVLKSENKKKCYCLALASVLASWIAPASAATPASTELEQIAKRVEVCKSEANEAFKLYTEKKGEKVVAEDFDGKAQCKVNAGGERESRNAHAVTHEIAKKRPNIFAYRGESEVHDLGACRMVYTTIQDAYDHFRQIKEKFCDDQEAKLSSFNQCGSVSKECLTDYKALRQVYLNFAKTARDDGVATITYMKKTAAASAAARKSYEEDRDLLQPEFGKRAASEDPATVAAALNTAPCLPAHPDLRPINGGKANCREYYEALTGTELVRTQGVGNDTLKKMSAKMIQEEVDAERKGLAFMKGVETLALKEYELSVQSAQRIAADIANLEKNGSVDTKKNSLLKDPSTLTGAASALPAAKKLMDGGSQIKDPISHDAPSLSGAAPGHAIEALAATSAGFGLGSLANTLAQSKAAMGGTAEPIGVAESAKGAVEKDKLVSALDDHGFVAGGGGTRKTGLSAQEAGVHGDLEKVAEASAAGLGGSPVGSSASRLPSSSNKGGHGSEANPASADGAGGSKGDEAAGLFAGHSLDPKSSKPTTAANPGGDVANLLGQMKNLFNFDEGNPMGAGNPAAGGGGMAPPTGGGNMDSGSPAAAAADSENPESGKVEVAAAAEGETESEMGTHSASPFGKVDMDLFARVRARHHHCMERGLVLYGLRERVE